ncbi:vacuolar protein sorting-associated protein 37A isoform X1 [Polistes fuscatus]|uniref:vacuolar protein sorting-associated protein 37A isoform X1 n=1 Tax=Polistes fuscatus TaxID=30207 RepID=UPI001CA7D7AD|nr:vacuolar protein sorting-associated protein 37A isoform X1 [Polistes fuscatus]
MISRIFRGENENVAVKRKRQIDTLKIFNDNVAELREDVEYQVQFNAGERRMAIMVSLSPEFPLEKPVLRVSPPINHPWCNEHSEITSAPGLLNFTVHSDLGRVVQAIIREFSKNPPQVIEYVSPGSAKPHRGTYEITKSSFPILFYIFRRVNFIQLIFKMCERLIYFIIDLQGRNSPSYSLQQYIDIPPTSYNSYYNTPFPQYSTSGTNPCIYNYNNTNSGNTYITDNQSKTFGSASQHSTYSSSSISNTLHNASPSRYTTNQHRATYLTYTNTNYHPTLPSCAQAKVVQSFIFPELNNLSNEELKKLNEDEDRQDEFLEKHSQLKDINTAIEDTIYWVEKTAKANAAKEPELKQLQADVTEKIQTVAVLKARYDQLIQRYNKLSEIFTPDQIKECLRQAADESHEKSEKIAEDFLNGKVDVERFLSTYIECRKLGQARRTKEEKLAHQLNELKRAGY